ncbi:MAG: MDR family MFS transporter [Vicinamibacterales bacterium]
MHLEYKYVVALIAIFGTTLYVLDTNIVNVAVPALEQDFHARTDTVEWVITAYPISLAMFLPFSGWAGDRFGTKRMFIISLGLFVGSSALCAFAWSIESLIAFRILQGVAGGLILPMGQTMVFRAFPIAERAKAAAITVTPVTFVSAIGPMVGGLFIDHLSWHWIFLMNLPIGIAGMVLAFIFLKEQREPNAGGIDLPGFVLAASGLACLLYGLSRAGQYGLNNGTVIGFSTAGVLLLWAFVSVERRVPRPMVDLRLLQNRLFAAATATGGAGFAAFISLVFLLPLFLQVGRGTSAFESGLIVVPQGLAVFACAPFMGRVYRRYGPRLMLSISFFLMALTAFAFLLVDFSTPLWLIGLLMVARGVGLAGMVVGGQAASFATIAAGDTGRASALNAIVRQVGGSFGVAIIATVLTSRLGHYGVTLGEGAAQAKVLVAVHETFFVAGVLSLIASATAFVFIRDHDAAESRGRVATAAAE